MVGNSFFCCACGCKISHSFNIHSITCSSTCRQKRYRTLLIAREAVKTFRKKTNSQESVTDERIEDEGSKTGLPRR